MNKHIVVFGAGKSATCLIDYLLQQAAAFEWTVTVADADVQLAAEKIGKHVNGRAVALDVKNPEDRQALIAAADIVVSMLPPLLHILVAEDCIHYKRNLLTASYIDESIRKLQPAIEKNNLLFLCEMGLDPGIDHMSIMQMINRSRVKGGKIESLVSHCGGLVAPGSDDNPWRYKVSWNPRNVVMAGKSGAEYRLDGNVRKVAYQDLFDENCFTEFPGRDRLGWYANRDSLAYIPVYGLEDTHTFIRTTLRYPQFCSGWKHIVELHLTDEDTRYDTTGLSAADFLQYHLAQHALTARFTQIISLNPLFSTQLECLGFYDHQQKINRGRCSAMDILQFALEDKLALKAHDEDMVLMLHEMTYVLSDRKHNCKSWLSLTGTNSRRTAMAKTVGLPLGIAATLILQGKINLTGLHIPVLPEIYQSVLSGLAQNGICFEEEEQVIP